MTNARLHWDDQDPRNTGWWLTYIDSDGTERGMSVEGEDDASLSYLAQSLTSEPHWVESGMIKVFRRGVQVGTITARDGIADIWLAL